jgi:hypothetical protein
MPRNAQGVYTLPAGNPVVAGTLIETTWANPTMSDIAAALTGSLPRDGSAPMTGPLILAGNAALPLAAVPLQQLEASLGSQASYTPAGTVGIFAMNAVPTGWLLCDGAAVSRTTWPNLFSAIGTTYGAGNGTTTFNVPDLRGQFIRGFDNGRGVDPGRALGSNQTATNQAHQHTATVSNPLHIHPLSDPGHDHPVIDGGHIHTGQVGTGTGSGVAGGSGVTQGGMGSAVTGIDIAANTTGVTVGAAAQETTVLIDSQGGESRPVNVAMVYCIRAIGALQTDGLGSMAFQNKDAVDITGGNGSFTTLKCTTAPVLPDDVARLADIGAGLADIFSADPQVLVVDKASPSNPILRPQTNVANGLCKLDASSHIPADVLNITDLTFLGTFSALAGTLPVGTFVTGDYYIIDVAGTLTLNTSSGSVAQPCNVGDSIIYKTDPVTGWWYSPAAVASSLPATAISFAPSGTIAATNVQAAVAELDSETQTALAGKAPTSAGTAIGTTFTPAGGIAATNVQAAIQELDTEKAPTSAGTAAGTSFTPTGTVGATDVQAAIVEVASEAAAANKVFAAVVFVGNGANGPCAIGSSFGIANVTKTGTGAYDVYFSVAQPNNEYVVQVTSDANGPGIIALPFINNSTGAKAAILAYTIAAAAADATRVHCYFLRP